MFNGPLVVLVNISIFLILLLLSFILVRRTRRNIESTVQNNDSDFKKENNSRN